MQQTTCSISCQSLTELSVAMCMGLNSLTLDLPVMTSLDLSMLGVMNLTLNCNKLMYANLRGSYKLVSSVRCLFSFFSMSVCVVSFFPRVASRLVRVCFLRRFVRGALT